MNKKITISELSQLLSTNVSLINKKGWEDFLRIFFAQISEGLQTEGNVKIKGLGTFKVVTVDARKSKDVNTGANTIIPAHNKISFTPDSALAETLNKPYAHFEPTYVLAPDGEVDAPENEEEEETAAEPIVEESKVEPEVFATTVENQTTIQTEPVVEQIAEEPKTEPEVIATAVENQTKMQTEPVVEQIAEEPKAEPEVIATVEEKQTETQTEPVVEQIIEEPKVEQVVEEAENEVEESEEKEEEDPNADDDENIDTTPEEAKAYASTYKRHDLPSEDTDEEDVEKCHGKKLGIAIILFLLILAVVGLVAWVSDPNIVSKMRDKLTGKETVNTEIKVDPVELEETKAIEEQIIAEKIENNDADVNNDVIEENTESKSAESTEKDSEEAEEKPVVKQDIKETTNFKDDFISYMKTKHPEMDIMDKGEPIDEKLGNASRLTLVSLRHYGAKDFWVYIYLYNKDVIKNPNNIKAGTKIKVPMLDNKKFVNPDSEHSILTAKEIQHKFVK